MSPFMQATGMALNVCAYLSKKPGEVVTAHKLATTLQYPETHLSKVLQLLGRRGILERRRGARGGYSLETEQATSLSALEVVEAVEGPLKVSPQATGVEKHVQEEVVCGMRRALDCLRLSDLRLADF